MMGHDEGRGYWAGEQDGRFAERRKAKATRERMIYFLGVAIDYIETIRMVNTEGIVEKFKQFRETVRDV